MFDMLFKLNSSSKIRGNQFLKLNYYSQNNGPNFKISNPPSLCCIFAAAAYLCQSDEAHRQVRTEWANLLHVILSNKCMDMYQQAVEGCEINQLLVFNMSSSEQSDQGFNDRQTKYYSCFCEKSFTTYPGIYLHLKSKHANLFQKYKKLKITKLFKKAKDQNGSEIYKLERISEKETANNNFSQKKIKENKKRVIQEIEDKDSVVEEIAIKPNAENSYKKNLRNAQHFHHLPPNLPYPLFPENKEFNQRMTSNPYFPPLLPPYFGFPFNQPFPSYPHMPRFPPPHFQSESTLKRLMQGFMNQAEQRKIYNKKQLKETLYELMVFIDKNSDFIDDPRIKEKIFLSYCDEFQPRYAGPLLADCISLKQEALMESQAQEKESRQRELDYLLKFVDWLKSLGMIDESIQKKKETQKTGLSLHAEQEKAPIVLQEK